MHVLWFEEVEVQICLKSGVDDAMRLKEARVSGGASPLILAGHRQVITRISKAVKIS